jgi:hypothetical protein
VKSVKKRMRRMYCDCEEEGEDEEDGEEEECGCDDDDLVEVIIEGEIIIA